MRDELGLKDIKIREVSPYRYTFADKNGIVENEICPILVSFSDQKPTINFNEVSDWKWIGWETFLEEIKVILNRILHGVRDEAIILNVKSLPPIDRDCRYIVPVNRAPPEVGIRRDIDRIIRAKRDRRNKKLCSRVVFLEWLI